MGGKSLETGRFSLEVISRQKIKRGWILV